MSQDQTNVEAEVQGTETVASETAGENAETVPATEGEEVAATDQVATTDAE